jgi:hypothetical protein
METPSLKLTQMSEKIKVYPVKTSSNTISAQKFIFIFSFLFI